MIMRLGCRGGLKNLQAYEFNSIIENGIIHIPQQYRDKMPAKVKVIVLTHEEEYKIQKNNFSAIRLKTKGLRFNREEANER